MVVLHLVLTCVQSASGPFKDGETRPPAILEDQPESSEADLKVPEQVSESSKPKWVQNGSVESSDFDG